MDPGKSLNCLPGHVARGRGLSMATKTEAMIPVRTAVVGHNTAVVEEEVLKSLDSVTPHRRAWSTRFWP